MTPKVIISYDGTANDQDALVLGRLFGSVGAELELAYVRHSAEADPARESAALIVVGSRPDAPQGRVLVSAANQYLIETSERPVLVVPRGVAVPFRVPVGVA